jgi:hypothetical protein
LRRLRLLDRFVLFVAISEERNYGMLLKQRASPFEKILQKDCAGVGRRAARICTPSTRTKLTRGGQCHFADRMLSSHEEV